MDALINLVVQAGPMLGGLVGVYMAIRVDIAKLSVKLESLNQNVNRVDGEVLRIREAMDRRTHAR